MSISAVTSRRPYGNSTFSWTEERVATLKRMIADGCTYTQIAERFGCTRNAISGKIDRLGLSGSKPRRERKAPVWRPVRRLVQQKPKPMPIVWPDPVPEPETIPDQITDLTPEQVANPISFLDLTNDTCRCSVADGLYCGAPANKRYCTHHHRMAHQPTRARAKPVRWVTW